MLSLFRHVTSRRSRVTPQAFRSFSSMTSSSLNDVRIHTELRNRTTQLMRKPEAAAVTAEDAKWAWQTLYQNGRVAHDGGVPNKTLLLSFRLTRMLMSYKHWALPMTSLTETDKTWYEGQENHIYSDLNGFKRGLEQFTDNQEGFIYYPAPELTGEAEGGPAISAFTSVPEGTGGEFKEISGSTLSRIIQQHALSEENKDGIQNFRFDPKFNNEPLEANSALHAGQYQLFNLFESTLAWESKYLAGPSYEKEALSEAEFPEMLSHPAIVYAVSSAEKDGEPSKLMSTEESVFLFLAPDVAYAYSLSLDYDNAFSVENGASINAVGQSIGGVMKALKDHDVPVKSAQIVIAQEEYIKDDPDADNRRFDFMTFNLQ